MTARLIYEKINLAVPGIEQRRFFNWLNDTIDEMNVLCRDDKYIFVNPGEKSVVDSLDDDINVKDLFAFAIVDNILFLAGVGDAYKSEFIRKTRSVYDKYARDDKKTRIIKKMRW
ncbi:MAG: hypothetical protein J6N52_03715 [Clostridia bacterium]|nr:hypothetical protein [Clostridia bacterium]